VVDVVHHLTVGTPIEPGDAGGATAGLTAGPALDEDDPFAVELRGGLLMDHTVRR
jgi:hypothetical protein